MRGIAVAAFFAVLGSVSLAGAAPLESLVSNTLTLTDSNDATTAYRFSDDGVYTRTSPSGAVSDGSWEVKDGKLCLTQTGGATSCLPWDGDYNVGDTWNITGPTGKVAYTAAIVEGR